MKSAAVVTKASGLAPVINRGLACLGSSADIRFEDAPETALTHFENKRPDLVLYDWASADARGSCDFLQKLRKLNGCRNVPVIVFAKDLSTQLVAIGTDYSISKILHERSLSETLTLAVEGLVNELSKPSSLRSHMTRLELAAEKQAFGEVDRIVEDFFALYPEHPRALVEYANLCIRRGNWPKARQTALKALSRFPDNLRVLNVTARLDMHEGRMQEAISSLEKADMLSPKNLERLVLFGDVYRKTGDNDLARAYYDQALEVDGRDADARKGMGQIELTEGDVNAALEMFRDSASEEEVGGFFNNMGVLAVRQREFEKAEGLYQAAREALSGDLLRAKVSFNLGLAYRKWDRVQDAVREFQRALSFDGGFEKARAALATFPPEIVAGHGAFDPAEAGEETFVGEAPPLVVPRDDAFGFVTGLELEETLAPDSQVAGRPPEPTESRGPIRVKDTEKTISPFSVARIEKTKAAPARARVDADAPGDKQEASAVAGPKPPAPKFLDDEEDF